MNELIDKDRINELIDSNIYDSRVMEKWEIKAKNYIPSFEQCGLVNSVSFSSDGIFIENGSDAKYIHIRNLYNFQENFTIKEFQLILKDSF